ncbi:hypothetical protein Anapl_14144 [Anas platyrhynchos]|uniref:Uncharacterized protein n=1 Tax=Anas platyrhynchos TaxID=8839 RepID=R0M0V1_ANAPL|nr:hypothetical protein Anapl_14144 [Anas platyrhynchos]
MVCCVWSTVFMSSTNLSVTADIIPHEAKSMAKIAIIIDGNNEIELAVPLDRRRRNDSSVSPPPMPRQPLRLSSGPTTDSVNIFSRLDLHCKWECYKMFVKVKITPHKQAAGYQTVFILNSQGLNQFDTGNCPACCTFRFNVSVPFLMNEGKYPSSCFQDDTNLSLEVCTSLNQSQRSFPVANQPGVFSTKLEHTFAWDGFRGYNAVQCFLCSVGVTISHPEKDYKDREPVSPNCTSMFVHTGIIFETRDATRVIIKCFNILQPPAAPGVLLSVMTCSITQVRDSTARINSSCSSLFLTDEMTIHCVDAAGVRQLSGHLRTAWSSSKFATNTLTCSFLMHITFTLVKGINPLQYHAIGLENRKAI